MDFLKNLILFLFGQAVFFFKSQKDEISARLLITTNLI